MTDFLALSCISSLKSLPFYIPEANKKIQNRHTIQSSFFKRAVLKMWFRIREDNVSTDLTGVFVNVLKFAPLLRPGSNAVHISRTQFKQLGSCEVRCLTQLSSTDFIWRGWGVLHAWPIVSNAWRPTLGQTAIFTWVDRSTHNQRSKGAILTLLWKTTEQDRFCYFFCVVDRFYWSKFDVWLKLAFF